MNDYGISVYGQPCRECGYSWATSLPDAKAIVAGLADRYGNLLSGTDGSARHADLAWSARAYVSHVSDNLRIWAQRLAGVAGGAGSRVARYNARQLGEARQYEDLPIEAVLWSLGRAVAEWLGAVELAESRSVVIDHPDRGPQSVAAVVGANAHDAYHHGWDIACCLGQAQRPAGSGASGVDLLTSDLARANRDLLRVVQGLSPSTVVGASRLPGWTRSHVLTHLARNADALRNLLLAARSGEPVRMYASPTTRSADIQAGATRPGEVVLSDVIEASVRFQVEARAMSHSDWDTEVLLSSGGPDPVWVPAPRLLGMRVEETVIHLVDLDAGFSLEHVDPPALARMLRSLLDRRRRQGADIAVAPSDQDWPTGPAGRFVVSGSLADLVGWLAGRSTGGVECDSGSLPALSPL